jgi:hypothetical protein
MDKQIDKASKIAKKALGRHLLVSTCAILCPHNGEDNDVFLLGCDVSTYEFTWHHNPEHHETLNGL